VLQFYPESPEQAVLISQCASRVGFAGGLVVDYPNSAKAKKFYLCLSFERSYRVPAARGTGADPSTVESTSRKGVGRMERKAATSERNPKKTVEWIKNKKDRMKKQGKGVKADSKFTGRKRPGGF
jgi:18S rRNA (guanine1575-N7)-methyltransferase